MIVFPCGTTVGVAVAETALATLLLLASWLLSSTNNSKESQFDLEALVSVL